MAKQASLHKMDGKADGRSYFYSQNGGYQSRAINPGMSQRVKTAPEYANTRRSNAEYGEAATYAGNIISTFTSRWKYMIHGNVIGKMIKDVLSMITSNSGVWGQRVLTSKQRREIITLLNKYGKNHLPDEIDAKFTSEVVSYAGENANEIKINNESGLEPGQGWGEHLASYGITGCQFILCAMKVSLVSYYSASNSMVEHGSNQYVVISDETVRLGQDDTLFMDSFELPIDFNFDSMYQPMAICLLCLPYKQIGNQRYTMQEHCSFKFVVPHDVE